MVKNKLIFLFIILILISFISAECSDGQVDINTASLIDLDKIIWVGSVTAQNIVDTRPFDSVEDLIRVSGIGEIKLQDIKEQGLACVDEVEEVIKEEKNKTKEEPEVIKIEIKTEEKVEEKKTINANPKIINTEDDTSKLIRSDYALFGFIIFSVLVLLLFMIKIIKRDKNEFD